MSEDCDVVSTDVDEVDGGTTLIVVSVAVDCVVCMGVVVGNGIVENDPTVRDVVVERGVVRSEVVVDVCRVEEEVLVVDARVKSLPTHSCTIRLPRCASLSSVSAELSTV